MTSFQKKLVFTEQLGLRKLPYFEIGSNIRYIQRAKDSYSNNLILSRFVNLAVPPFVTVHPESKIRLPGQNATFCCNGRGNPPPEIEW